MLKKNFKLINSGESKYFTTTNFIPYALSNVLQIVINFGDTQLTILNLEKNAK
jgi:hypothetical protein